MIEDLYNVTFDLYSYVVIGKNTYGGVNRVLVLRLNNIPCYETEITEEEAYLYGRQNVIADHLFFASPLSICSTDKIYCKGIWYDVSYIDDCNNMDHHFEILARKVVAPEVYNYTSSSDSDEESSSESESTNSTSSRTSSSTSSES